MVEGLQGRSNGFLPIVTYFYLCSLMRDSLLLGSRKLSPPTANWWAFYSKLFCTFV